MIVQVEKEKWRLRYQWRLISCIFMSSYRIFARWSNKVFDQSVESLLLQNQKNYLPQLPVVFTLAFSISVCMSIGLSLGFFSKSSSSFSSYVYSVLFCLFVNTLLNFPRVFPLIKPITQSTRLYFTQIC